MYTAVAAVTSSDAWAVGGSAIIHWNGRRWARFPAPTANDSLRAISAISRSDVWAVGFTSNGSSEQTVTVHWNGRHWRRAASPNLATGAGSTNWLTGVAGSSARNVWAVGFGAATGGYHSLILHWNGTTWKHVPSPDPASATNTELAAVSADGADAWAAGSADINSEIISVILHWNGRSWRQVRSPDPGGGRGSYFNGIAAASRTSVWAVGAYGVGLLSATRTFIAHWNGRSWHQVRSPSPGTGESINVLYAATTRSGNTWAVGCYTAGETGCGTLMERSTRTTWTTVPSGPRP
jgi:hypothetical protein